VLQSNRYGNQDLFVQGLDQRHAQDFVVGVGDQKNPQLAPDGTSFLYWESQAGANRWNDPRRLLRIPVGGGPTEFVLEIQRPAAVHCATTPDGPCLLLETRPEERIATLSWLDPVAGKGEELWREEVDPTFQATGPSLSPDGSRLAMAWNTKIGLRDTITGDVAAIDVDGLPGMSFTDVEWAPDGSGFYLAGASPRGVALLHVDLQGEAHVLYEDQVGALSSVKPSPDGRHLAFRKSTSESNVWMIEDF
jgi:Tol biopolymer transport system component